MEDKDIRTRRSGSRALRGLSGSQRQAVRRAFRELPCNAGVWEALDTMQAQAGTPTTVHRACGK